MTLSAALIHDTSPVVGDSRARRARSISPPAPDSPLIQRASSAPREAISRARPRVSLRERCKCEHKRFYKMTTRPQSRRLGNMRGLIFMPRAVGIAGYCGAALDAHNDAISVSAATSACRPGEAGACAAQTSQIRARRGRFQYECRATRLGESISDATDALFVRRRAAAAAVIIRRQHACDKRDDGRVAAS